jgi:lambda family phage portal protein
VKIFGFDVTWGRPSGPPTQRRTVYDVGQLNAMTGAVQVRSWDGEKFHDGYGATEVYELDYWTLRARSVQLFTSNLYARGLVRRLVTNEIGIGLFPDATPHESILGLGPDSLEDWVEDIEVRFALWGDHSETCDYRERSTFAMLQAEARQTALIEGDVLVVLRADADRLAPRLQLINGSRVQSPGLSGPNIPEGHEVRHGVELDKRGRIVAHWVLQDDGEFERLPAFAPATGRPMSWLVYGTDKRMGDVRGQPLLSLVLQSLRELDRYRDAVTRKAVVNSYLAMFIKKTKDKPGSLPITAGAVRKDAAVTQGGVDGPREWAITKHSPGMVIEELQQGEEPSGFNSEGIDLDFGKFEEAIVSTMAWCYQLPPEILKLAFSSNYSASQASINELKQYLLVVWKTFGATFCAPIYRDWLLSLALAGRIEADGLVDSYGDPAESDVWAAWTAADWFGSIKPSTDALKLVKASQILVTQGWSTNARETRMLTGTKFRANLKKLERENRAWVEARRPIAEFQQEFGGSEPGSSAAGEESDAARSAAEEPGSDLREEKAA